MKKIVMFLIMIMPGTYRAWSQHYLVNPYTAKQFNAHTLMWDMAEDKEGRLWFANNDGVVRFDGNNWFTFKTPNPVRKLVVTKQSEIFVACLEDIGVIRFTPDGGTSYTSFRSQLEKSVQLINGEENVFLLNDEVYFSTGNTVVKVTEKEGAYSLAVIDKEKSLGCGVLRNKLLVNHAVQGLGRLVNGRYTPVVNGVELAGKQVVQMLSFGQNDYIFTNYDGVYRLEENNTLTKAEQTVFNKLTQKGIADVAVVNTKLLAIATYHDGVYLLNTALEEQLFPKLPSGEMYHIGVDHEQNLWVCHQRGVSQVLTGLPVREFLYPVISGTINTIRQFNGVVYLSTTNGLYTTATDNPSKLERAGGINHECWDIEPFRNRLYAATTNGLYTVEGKKSNLVIPNEIFLKLQTGNVSGNLYAFGVNNLYQLDSRGAVVKKLRIHANSVFENKDGSVWLGTNHNGLQKLRASTVSQQDIPEGLLKGKVTIGTTNGRPFFQSADGVYLDENNRLQKDDELSELLSGNNTEGLEIGKRTWFFTDKGWRYLVDGKPELVNIAYTLNGKPTAYFHGATHGWFAAEDKIYLIQGEGMVKSGGSRATISRVGYGRTGVVFNGVLLKETTDEDNVPEISYNEQTITIWFGINSFVNPLKHCYRYKIEGLTNRWSEWSSDPKVVLTGLSGGRYTFELEARDAYGKMADPCSYSFYVKPPWYLNGVAFFVYIMGFVVLMYGAVLIYNRRLVAQNTELEKRVEERTVELKNEKQKSDELLLNILPEGVADELKKKGSAEAKQYDNVTVLFTDMVNFTGISEQMTPKELVAEIHRNFTAFDDIIGKFGLEKIKTIGDAYLAVCGLPVANNDHAVRVVNAAMAIRQYMIESNGKFQIRIGIHSGPVVAGIVGVKKYAYDIWGDTVNTAARMEQSSEAGKINISAATYEMVKNTVECEYRGKIKAKNKGEVDMYFVNHPLSKG